MFISAHRRLVVFSLLTVLLLLGACVPAPAAPAPAPAAPAAPAATVAPAAPAATAAPAAAAPAAGKKLKIGATFHSTYHEFFAAMIAGMKDQAAKVGAELTISDENMDVGKQNATMDTFIQQKYDCIVLLAIDPEALNAAAGDAMKAKIPVIVVDGPISNKDNYVTFIGSDSYAMGKMAGQAAKDYITKEMGGKAIVAALGWLSHPVSVKRVTGFKEIVETLPGVQFRTMQEADSRDKALTVAENVMQANKDLDFFYGGNEGTVMGELSAVESAGKTGQIKIAGIDISKDVIRAIEEGKIPFVVTQQPAQMGVESINACQKALAGETLPKNMTIDSTIVNKDNVAQYK
jgi:ribose transport system substrate-binding protein